MLVCYIVSLLRRTLVLLHHEYSTGWFEAYRPNFVQHPMFTPFWEIDSEIWHACSMILYLAVDEWRRRGWGGVRQKFFASFFRDVWVLGDPKFPTKNKSKQKKQNTNIRQRLRRDSYNTCVPNCRGLSPKNGVNIRIFERKTCVV